MDELIKALAPVFAAGMGIQQLGEILDPILDKVSPDMKRVVLGLLSLSLGLVVAFQFDLQVLKPLGAATQHARLDQFITGVIISAGTEGINSILKFLKYTKEDKKNQAAAKTSPTNNVPPGTTAAVATTTAVAEISKK
jgi:hypothetical protein